MKIENKIFGIESSLRPSFTYSMTLGVWLSVVLIGVGIISIILGFLDKGKAVIKEEVKEIKKDEQIENKIQ